MLHDDMIHGARAGTRRIRRIETETPVLPHVIAACVVEEASAWLYEPLPDAWVRELTAKADTVYTYNERFRRRPRAAAIRAATGYGPSCVTGWRRRCTTSAPTYSVSCLWSTKSGQRRNRRGASSVDA